MADSDYSLLSLLTSEYPNVPKFTVLRVINKYENDEEKCRQALDSETGRSSNNADSESLAAAPASNSNNNLESPGEGKSIAARIKELQMSVDSSSQLKPNTSERHVSTIERPAGNTSRPPEPPRRPVISQSVSWNVQASERPSGSPAGAQAQSTWTPTSSKAIPQTAPPDFSPFFNQSARDIPNIHCKTSGVGSGVVGPGSYGAKLHQISNNSSSASNSPVEQRRPVKVINIPAGLVSGGSVSSASTSSNPRLFRMHFGDTGGICTVSAPPSTVQHYGPASNAGTFRSEIRTEASTPQPVHSSSIVVNTSSHSNHLAPDRKLSAGNMNSDTSGNGRRTPVPPTSFNTGDSSPGSSNVFSSGKLSTPVQASSPGITHSRPVFVEIKTDRMPGSFNDTSYPPSFFPGANVRPPPSHMGYMPHQSGAFGAQGTPISYGTQYNPDFSNATGFPLSHPQQELYLQNPQQKKLQNFSGTSVNLYPQTAGTGFNSTSYPHFSTPINILGYPLIGIAGPVPGQASSHLSLYPHIGHTPSMHVPKSPSGGQMSLGSRSNSQESEHSLAADFDPRHPPYSTMGSRVSSHSSLSSDSSSSHIDRTDPSTRPRSGSIQDDAEYIRALVQHQKSQVQKLREEANQHRVILNSLRSDVSLMEKNMIEASHVSSSFPSIQDISGLCESNRRLQTDIQLMMNEIDMYKSGHISQISLNNGSSSSAASSVPVLKSFALKLSCPEAPINKISPLDQQNFFANMPTGQQNSIYSRTSDGRRSSPPRTVPPPRPPPPIPPPRQRSVDPVSAGSGVGSSSDIFTRVPPVPPAQPMISSGDSEEGESWNCSACTFSNHPALKKCEMCEMPRVMPPHPASSLGAHLPTPPPQSLSSLPPRLAPGLVGGIRHRSASPHSPLGHHHHHHAGT